ncbi:ribose 5-phosphate isomerase B [Metaclostridioides mangenotii]|uniref:ribose 5-phosphate isomerase B n=1 Tax=Metaclostridioides mangenotii TaxID=1540 RepID=UPI000466582B|nr:ribose 5-phosphate isomerase B [Clostridioides mangenotii]
MKIGLGSDHGGYNLKKDIIAYLEKKGIECVDFGTKNNVDSVDYPIYGEKVAEAVVSKDVDYGILCCGTGIGISLAANKVPGIRCAVVSDTFSAKMSKAHNDANMLSLGERVLGRGLALEIVDAWIETEFEGGRHDKRVNIIKSIEEKYNKK